MIHLFFAYIIASIHVCIIAFAVFGCAFPLIYVKYHILMFPIIYLQWEINNHRCMLTDVESYLLQDTHEPLWPIMQKYINTFDISNDQITIVILVVLISSFVISCVRLTIKNDMINL